MKRNLVALVQTLRERDDRSSGRLAVGSEAQSLPPINPEDLHKMGRKIAEQQAELARKDFLKWFSG